MTGKKYDAYVRPFRNRPERVRKLKLLDTLLTASGYIIYPLILIFLIIKKDRRLKSFLLIPAVGFALVSLFRKKIDLPRPYEDPEIRTLSKREKKGQSFPSRHVYSYFVIAVLLTALFPLPGLMMLVLGGLLAWVRVVLGVHYPRDVAAGGILGLLTGLLAIMAIKR